jgi:hypothetical protein
MPEVYVDFAGALGGTAFNELVDYPCKTCGNRPTIAFFYGAGPKEKLTLNWAIKTYRKRMPSAMIPFASEGMGNQICIAVGSAPQRVFLWDHENEQKDPESFKNMHLLANSLTDWTEGMSPM